MSHTLEVHFLGRSPHVLEIYRMVVAAAGEFGLVVEDSKKTSIHLNRRSAFAGIQTRREFLILTVKSESAIDDPRITKREQASTNRRHHEVKINRPNEIDHRVIEC